MKTAHLTLRLPAELVERVKAVVPTGYSTNSTVLALLKIGLQHPEKLLKALEADLIEDLYQTLPHLKRPQ